MNAPQFHLALNHLPVIVPAMGALIIFVGFFSTEEVRKTGLWVFIGGALSTIPTYITGEPAEKIIKNYPGISLGIIHEHEHWALKSFIAVELLAVAALILLFVLRTRRTISRKVWFLFILGCLVSTFLFLKTAHVGGEIRHEEILGEEQT